MPGHPLSYKTSATRTTYQVESPEAFHLSPALTHLWVSDPGLGLHASFFDGGEEGCMVAFGLVRVGLGE